MLINLPGVDDVRTTACQDRPQSEVRTGTCHHAPGELQRRSAGRERPGGHGLRRPGRGAPTAAVRHRGIRLSQLGFERFNAEYFVRRTRTEI